MNDGFEDTFEKLEPPRDGLAGLRVRIERERRRQLRLRRTRTAAATLVVLAAAALVFFLSPGHPAPWSPGFSPTGVRLRLASLPGEPVTIPARLRADLAARRVPLENERVVFYLVGSRAEPPSPPDPGAPAE